MLDDIIQDIVENLLEGVIVIGDDYRIKYMNRFAREITGFASTTAENKFCYEVLRAKRCKNTCPIKMLKEGKEVGEIIVDIIARDNTEKFIKAKVIGIRGHWVEIFHDVTRELQLEKRIKGTFMLGDIITRDDRLLEILAQFPQIADSMVPVLLEGESGVGKEVFSTVLRDLGSRKDAPFVKINCASLPESLLESELFGYKKGAFTDARKDKPGLFKTADKGTLFLDEIGEMSLPLQAKLLRAVETGEIIPLGSTEAQTIDVRILSATNKDISTEVAKGNFREDLYYRLNVVNIKIPALRERKTDIPLFIDYFINQFNIIQQKKVSGIAPDALEILLNHHFPGNIRELRNIMEYIFIFCNSGPILPANLPGYLWTGGSNSPDNREPIKKNADGGEREQIVEALNEAHWNKKRAAEILGVDRSTLWRKMKKHGIQ
ncbi:MAG: Fis family transcriptional regulator [bacterium]|nr:Fis family transcriptional regulator [bacterium]